MLQQHENFMDSKHYMFRYDDHDHILGFDVKEHDRRVMLADFPPGMQKLSDFYRGVILELQKKGIG